MRTDYFQLAKDHCAEIAVHLLGPPNKRISTSKEYKWGDNGKLSLTVNGANQGKFADWGNNEHGDISDLIERELNLPQGKVVTWLKNDWFRGRAEPIDHSERARQQAAAEREDEQGRKRKQKAAFDIWEASKPLEGSPAERYLVQRLCGLKLKPWLYEGGALRWSPECRIKGRSDIIGAMVAKVENVITGQFTCIHRTFLDNDFCNAKDGAGSMRKMLGPNKHGAVKLWNDADITTGLAIAEGIETALSADYLKDVSPIWAVLNAGGLRTFPVLNGLEALTLVVDNDKSNTGQNASEECAERWRLAGCEAHILTPKSQDTDFNDTLRNAMGVSSNEVA